jgi:hypothetical protein
LNGASILANQMEWSYRDWVTYRLFGLCRQIRRYIRSQDEVFYCCGDVPHRLRWSTIGMWHYFKTIVVSIVIVQLKRLDSNSFFLHHARQLQAVRLPWQNCRLDSYAHRGSLECRRKAPTNNVTTMPRCKYEALQYISLLITNGSPTPSTEWCISFNI